MPAKNLNQYVIHHVCPICKKHFVTMSAEYVYRARIHRKNSREQYFCSYTCWRKITKPKEDKIMRRIRRELSGKYYTANGEPIRKKKEVA